jgi:hypothetical protein
VNRSNVNEHTHSSKHGHVDGVRLIQVQTICMRQRNFIWGKSLVKAVLSIGSRVISAIRLFASAALTWDRITTVGTEPNERTICRAT